MLTNKTARTDRLPFYLLSQKLLSDRFPEYGHLSLYVLSQKMLTDRAPMNLLNVIILFDE